MAVKNVETPGFSGVSGVCIHFGHTSWQRVKDSNPHIQSQSLLCYHYTNPLFLVCHSGVPRSNRYYYTRNRVFVNTFF